METTTAKTDELFIWGIDHAAYGPVPLPTLREWIKDERVFEDTWVYLKSDQTWRPAREVPELRPEFKRDADAESAAPAPGARLKPGSLRRIKILANLSDMQLAHLLQFLEPLSVLQWDLVCRQGDVGDGLYLVLSGELRARLLTGGEETILATFEAGEFFGDMSLFDQGPRSADVVANTDCLLIKMSVENFNRLVREAPVLATPFLQASARTLAARIRADNKRLARLVQQFAASGERRPIV
jgi:CRP-like cAMP-binding protein